MPALPSKGRLNAHYIALQAGFWAVFAAICAYQAALLQARGFSNAQVGVIVALRCLAGVAAQPLIGSWADRHPQVPLKRLLAGCLVLSFFAGLLLFLPMGMAGTSLLFVVLGALEISAYPLIDAMAMQFLHAGAEVSYSLGRGLGSLSYAVVCVFLGLQAQRFGVESTLFTHTALMVVLIILTLIFPAYDCRWALPRDGAAPQAPRSALRLLRENPRFTLMLLGILLGLAGVLPLSNFLINIVRSRGGQEAHLGLALFLMASFELPGAALFSRLYRRGRAGRILVASMVFMALKAGLLLLTGDYRQVWLVQPIQMLGYGLFTPASVFYVSDVVPEADQVKGQTLMMVASNGLGGVLGSFLAGRALDAGGVSAMVVLSGGLCLAAAAVTAAAVFLRRPSRG